MAGTKCQHEKVKTPGGLTIMSTSLPSLLPALPLCESALHCDYSKRAPVVTLVTITCYPCCRVPSFSNFLRFLPLLRPIATASRAPPRTRNMSNNPSQWYG